MHFVGHFEFRFVIAKMSLVENLEKKKMGINELYLKYLSNLTHMKLKKYIVIRKAKFKAFILQICTIEQYKKI